MNESYKFLVIRIIVGIVVILLVIFRDTLFDFELYRETFQDFIEIESYLVYGLISVIAMIIINNIINIVSIYKQRNSENELLGMEEEISINNINEIKRKNIREIN